MTIRSARPLGYTYTADYDSSEGFSGKDLSPPIGMGWPFPPPTVDTVVYEGPYLGSNLINHAFSMSMGFTSFVPSATRNFASYEEISADPTVDTFRNIDRIKFDNGIMILERDDPAFAVDVLYQYIGKPVPAQAGFEFWTNAFDSGFSLNTIADLFVGHHDSAFGAASNSAFVENLYENIFGYAGTPEGRAFWVGNLEAGLCDQGDTLAEFVKIAVEVTGQGSSSVGVFLDWA